MPSAELLTLVKATVAGGDPGDLGREGPAPLGRRVVLDLRYRLGLATAAVARPRWSMVPPVADPIEILIVEDDPLVVMAIEDALSCPEIELLVAHSENDAFSRVASNRIFRVVVMALGSSRKNRFDLLRRLSTARPGLPIVISTGHNLSHAQVKQEMGDAGRGRLWIVHKPWEAAELRAAVSLALGIDLPPASPPQIAT